MYPFGLSEIGRKFGKSNDVTIFRHEVTIKIFWRCFVSSVKFSYWSKFHVNIIIGSGVMTIFFYKGLTRNPEIGNTPVWVLSNIWRVRWVANTKFDKIVLPYKALFTIFFTFFSFFCFYSLLCITFAYCTSGFSHCDWLSSNARCNFLASISSLNRVESFHDEEHICFWTKKLGTNFLILPTGKLSKQLLIDN